MRWPINICVAFGLTAACVLPAQATDDPATTGSITLPGLPPAPREYQRFDAIVFKQALAAYRKRDIAGGDALAARLTEPGAGLALEWAALRLNGAQAGLGRIRNFLGKNPDFPMAEWLTRRTEDALFAEKSRASVVFDTLGAKAPEMATGRAMLALTLRDAGEDARAAALVRRAWRDNTLSETLADFIDEEFPWAVQPADRRYRAFRLIYAEETREGLKHAAKLGASTLSLARALAASVDQTGNEQAAIDAVPPEQRGDPAFLFVRIQRARRSGQIETARDLMRSAPREAEALIDGNAWWVERRLIARALLDRKQPYAAYEIAAAHSARSAEARAEAEFHAGWIALRFLDNPSLAQAHFLALEKAASLPASRARAAYWLGRAALASGESDGGSEYRRAAQHGATFYGQLARDALDMEHVALPEIRADEATHLLFRNAPLGQALQRLLEAGARDLVQPLVIDLARTTQDAATLDALGAILAENREPRLLLLLGKTATQRGMALSQHAFPTMGIPDFTPTEGAAEKPMVYAIARQESEFNQEAVSHAGARGLMQMLPATARATAKQLNIPFDANRLTRDGAFNAQLGAAHLGDLIRAHRGSYILSFAAYNAGPGRVKEWIAAYGDPRDPAVDPIDWIERIPFSETRHYVQKIMENLQAYQARLAGGKLTIAADLLRGRRAAPQPGRWALEEYQAFR